MDNKTKVKPFPGMVMIKPEPKKKEIDGIELPESSEIKTYYAEVIAVGDPKGDEGMPCKIGDTILYNKWASNEVKIDGIDFAFMRVPEILAVIER